MATAAGTATATEQDRKSYEVWLGERLREEDIVRRAAARRKNGWWRNFWTEYGGDLVFVATVLGALTIFAAVYLAMETAGWFRL